MRAKPHTVVVLTTGVHHEAGACPEQRPTAIGDRTLEGEQCMRHDPAVYRKGRCGGAHRPDYPIKAIQPTSAGLERWSTPPGTTGQPSVGTWAIHDAMRVGASCWETRKYPASRHQTPSAFLLFPILHPHLGWTALESLPPSSSRPRLESFE